MTIGHGGNLRELARRAGRDPTQILDFSASVNPLGPPDGSGAAQPEHRPVGALSRSRFAELVESLARRHQVPPSRSSSATAPGVLLCPGPGAAFDRAVIPVPSYTDYAAAVGRPAARLCCLKLDESDGLCPRLATPWKHDFTATIWCCWASRTIPPGRALDADAFRALPPASRDDVCRRRGVRRFHRGLSLAGPATGRKRDRGALADQVLRDARTAAGLCRGRPELARQIRGQILPWSVSALAQAAAWLCWPMRIRPAEHRPG